MNDEQMHHLIDLLEMDIAATLMNISDRKLLNKSQKEDAIKYNIDLIKLLKDDLKVKD